jgi:cytochrome P450
MTDQAARTPRFDIDLYDPGLINDPYPVYEQIRALGPAVWNEKAYGWMLPNFAECAEVLGDPRGERFGVVGARHPEVTFWFDAPNMIIADGAEHRRLRQAVSGYFTPTAIANRWTQRVREVVEALLEPVLAGDTDVDLIADFTMIPVVIVAEMLGVPEEHHEDFRRWSNVIITNLSYGHETPDKRKLMDDAISEVNEYLSESIEQHRRDEPDDLLTVMVKIPDWSEAEIRSSAINILLAGYDTTAKLMGQCLVALEEHPDQRALVVADPALVPNAIEEVLRCYGSSQAVAREVVTDCAFGEAQLKAGDIVYALLLAGNRDPTRWPDPQRFDVRREFKLHLGQPHLGFGLGPHICLGMPLARVETQVALETLLRHAPEYRLREVDYGHSWFVRGPESGVIEVGVTA